MHKITTLHNNNYLYDPISNNFIQCNERITDIPNLDSLYRVKFEGPNISGDYSLKKPKHLILEITDKCNLRCDYCVHSGHYEFEKKHGTNVISRETAMFAISNMLKDTSAEEIKHIGFYGAEPTLEFELVKDLTEYAKSITSNIHFSINTNHVKTCKENLNFLIKNDFLMMISIDGPKDRHDLYRKDFAGRGSFSRVRENLEQLRKINPSYYKKNTLFLATIGKPYDLKGIRELIEKDELFQTNWHFSQINPFDCNLDADINPYADLSFKQQIMEEADIYINQCINNKVENSLGTWLFGNTLKKIMLRDFSIITKSWINNCCNPGEEKVFVSTDGKYHMCEKSGELLRLGSVNDGFSLNGCQDIIDSYTKDCQKNCQGCLNLRFCNLCYLAAKKNDHLDFNRKRKSCEAAKDATKVAFYIYLSVLEKNPNGLDYLMDIDF